MNAKVRKTFFGTLVFLFIVCNATYEKQVSAVSSSNEYSSKQIFVNVSRKLIPSVVNIYTTSILKTPQYSLPYGGDDLWQKFFEDFLGGQSPFSQNLPPNMAPNEDQDDQEEDGESAPSRPPGNSQNSPKAMALGSGFIVEKTDDGALILTNNHVVENADEIKIKFTETWGEKETVAEIVGRDPELDVALLKVKTAKKLQPVELGNSDDLEVGEWVTAIGNPFGHGHTVTHGIISANQRTLPGSYSKYLQVDVPINPGNSGGPLVNLDGKVIGINNAIDARGPSIGFSIPINLVKHILPQLKEKGKVERGYIGINVDELRSDLAKKLKLDEDKIGPIVTHVLPGEAGEKAGVKAYDVILEVDGKRVRYPLELINVVTAIPVGKVVKIKLIRSGAEKVLEVKVGNRPGSGLADSRSKKGPREKPKGKVDTGMWLETVTPEIASELGLPKKHKGVVVERVRHGGPAHMAGLARGDVIIEVDRKPISSEADFYKLVSKKKTYLLRVRRRDGAFVVVMLKLGSTDSD